MTDWHNQLCCSAHDLHGRQAPEVLSSNLGRVAYQYMQVN